MTSTGSDRQGLTPDPSTALKGPVRVATTAAITLAGLQTIDGVALAANDRVLVKNQADTTANGIYVAKATAWARATDFNGARDCVKGTRVFIGSGTAYAGMEATLTTADPVVFGSSNITFALLSVVDTTIAANLQTVADNLTDIEAVAAIADDVATVADNAANIQAVIAASVFKYLYATSTSMADPSSGNIRLNNGTLASVTAAAISNTFSGGSDISDFIATWDDNTHSPKSILTLRKAGDADFFAIYGVTAVTDNGAWLQLTLSFIATGGGTLSAADALYLANAPGGNDGSNGSNGVGSGDVMGPASSVDNNVPRFDGTGGKTLQASALTISDAGDATLTSTDAGATAGPSITLDRNSASPAASDVLGALVASGRDSGGDTDTYAQQQAEIIDATASSEDGIWNWLTKIAGTLASRMKLGAGLYMTGATGGDQGAGTVNATGLYVNGVAVSSGSAGIPPGYATQFSAVS